MFTEEELSWFVPWFRPIAQQWPVTGELSCQIRMICQNPHKKARQLLARHPKWISSCYLSTNPSDWAMDLLDGQVTNVEMFHLAMNPSERAVQIVLETYHGATEWSRHIKNWSKNMERHMAQLCINPNPRMVELCLTLLEANRHREPEFSRAFRSFCKNPNSKAVEFVLAQPNLLPSFAVYLCYNSHDRVVDFMLQNESHIHLRSWANNPNPRAVQYLSERMTSAQNYVCELVCNPNRHAFHMFTAFAASNGPRCPNYYAITNPNVFVRDDRLHLMYLWTHAKQSVIYRLPLELIRMIVNLT